MDSHALPDSTAGSLKRYLKAVEYNLGEVGLAMAKSPFATARRFPTLQEHRLNGIKKAVQNVRKMPQLPVLLEMLLRELPPFIKMAERIRVNADKDTYVVTRIVQRWRTPTNPISNTIGASLENFDFLIAAPYADTLPLKVAEYVRKDTPFAILIPMPLLNEIDRVIKTDVDLDVRKRRLQMKLIVSSSLGQAWLINHPKCLVKDTPHSVFFTQLTESPELNTASQKIFSDWSANHLGYDEVGTQSVLPSALPGGQDMDEVALLAIDSLFRDGRTHTNETALMGETTSSTKSSSRSDRAARCAHQSTDSARAGAPVVPTPSAKTPRNPSSQDVRATNRLLQTNATAQETSYDQPDDECDRTGRYPVHVVSLVAPPKSIALWPEFAHLGFVLRG
jgi:hypothetical protein